jgi:hypothetical protein
MTCRALYSASRRACETALAGVGDAVPFIREPQALASAFDLGIACALRKKRGLDVEMVEMGGALLSIQNGVDEAFALWSQGGAPFSAFQARPAHIPSQADMCDALLARLHL